MIPYIIYLGVVLSGIAYVCYFYGLSNVNTSTGSMIYFIKPIVVAVISVKVLHESLNINFFIGTFIIILGLIIVNHKFILSFKNRYFMSASRNK
jgi:drug/metabolite transporter (DMT)-like permease